MTIPRFEQFVEILEKLGFTNKSIRTLDSDDDYFFEYRVINSCDYIQLDLRELIDYSDIVDIILSCGIGRGILEATYDG